MPATGQITGWLRRLRDGDEAALDILMPLVYDELHGLARLHLRKERQGHTLGATALVNEAYLRLVDQQVIDAADRAQFFTIAGVTMRRLLCDYARKRGRLKRGSGSRPVPLEDVERFLSDEEADEVLALDEALDRLEAIDPRACAVVQHRFFSGLTLEETAEVLGVSVRTARRDWTAARAWLRAEINRELHF